MSVHDLVKALEALAVRYEPLLKGLAIGSAAFFLVTPVAAPALIVLMPKDALVRGKSPAEEKTFPGKALSLLGRLLKNMLASALMLLGVLLLFLPGQGLLTLFAGIMLADVPGKRALLARILGTGKIRPAVDRLRERRGKEPLIYPGDPVDSESPPGEKDR